LFCRLRRVMTYARDRKRHKIRAAHQTCEQIQVMLDAAVVMQQYCAQPCGKRAQVCYLVGTSANIKQRDAIKPGHWVR
jgi:hypothetical protein